MNINKIKAMADVRKSITMEDAKKLPGLLGFCASIELRKNGYYAYTNTTNSKKVFLELA